MDAQPLMVVKPEDLRLLVEQFSYLVMLGCALAVSCGFAGVFVAQVVRAGLRAIRARLPVRPFAERVQAKLAMHEAAAGRFERYRQRNLDAAFRLAQRLQRGGEL